MTVAVSGATGMLGEAVVRALDRKDIPVAAIKRLSTTLPADTHAVVHCAALTDAEVCERAPEAAYEANAWWPGELAKEAERVAARFVHISSVAVYKDETVYARTKRAGEARVLAAYPEAIVLRPMIFGWTRPDQRRKLAEKILTALRTGEQMKLWNDFLFSPLYTGDLADVILHFLPPDARGVLDVGSVDVVTQTGFGRMMADVYGLDDSCLVGTATEHRNLSVEVERVTDLLGCLRLPTVREGLERFRREEPR